MVGLEILACVFAKHYEVFTGPKNIFEKLWQTDAISWIFSKMSKSGKKNIFLQKKCALLKVRNPLILLSVWGILKITVCFEQPCSKKLVNVNLLRNKIKWQDNFFE